MITMIDLGNQDVEDTIDRALSQYAEEHSRNADFLIVGRMAYEEFRDMLRLDHRNQGVPQTYKGMVVVVVEEPTNALMIGSKPD